MKVQRQWLVEAQARRKDRVVAVGIRRTPVVRNRCIKAFSFFGVHPPESLARHPIQEIVAGPRGGAIWQRELSRIVGGPELIETRITFSSVNIVEGSHRRRFLARSESN